MRLLIVSQYFFPETFIINDLVLEMEKQGHQVTVLTGKPNYPDGKLFSGHKFWGVQKESYGKSTEVIRVPLRPRGRGGAKNLLLNYLSYVLFASVLGPWLLRKKKIDSIFVFAPSPITQTIPALVIKFFKRAPVTLWILDLWPQSLSVTGFIKNPYLLKLVELMVWVIYRACDLVMIPSKAFEKPIKAIYSKTNTLYYPNSYKKMEERHDLALPEDVREVLKNNFSIVFAGNIGKAQAVETIVEAAELLRDLPMLKIIFVGSGSMSSWLLEQKVRKGLHNIECVGRFDISYMSLIYADAKAMLLTLKMDEILRYTLPWKTQSYMAAGKPIIGAIDGEGATIIRDSGAGIVGPAEDAIALAENIRTIYQMSSDDLSTMSKKSFDYYNNHFEMVTQVHRLMSSLPRN